MEVVEEGGNYVCTLREARLGDPMTVSLAFLTNKKELAPGDLLVLSFDACLSHICCEAFPPAASTYVADSKRLLATRSEPLDYG